MKKVTRIQSGVSNLHATPYSYAALECGHEAAHQDGDPPRHTSLIVGDVVACEPCDTALVKATEILATHDVVYTRARRSFGMYQVTFYERVPSSPTGVHACGEVPDVPEVAALLRGALSPLSPTESAR